MGVSYDTERQKYRAIVWWHRKPVHVGRFDTYLKAIRAHNRKRRELEEAESIPFFSEEAPHTHFDKSEFDTKPTLWDRIKTVWQRKQQDS